MSIKENQLPTAEAVSANNLIRTVSDEGKSENMTVEQLGGLIGEDTLIITLTNNNGTYSADKTLEELNTFVATGNYNIVAILPGMGGIEKGASIYPLINFNNDSDYGMNYYNFSGAVAGVSDITITTFTYDSIYGITRQIKTISA